MANPDILYQPGAQGGGTLTTNAPQFNVGPMQPPPGFDMSWLKQLAERRAMQEASDREAAKRRMLQEDRLRQKMLDQQDSDRQRQRMESVKHRSAPEEGEEVWVDAFTGQPARPWYPNAMNTHRREKPMSGTGGGVQGDPQGPPTLSAPQRWAAEAAAAQPKADDNLGRGGRYTQITGWGGW